MISTSGGILEENPAQTLNDLQWLIEQVLLEGDLPIDRSGLRRALQESQEATAAEGPQAWWVWVIEAANSLGLRCRASRGRQPSWPSSPTAVLRSSARCLRTVN